VTAVSHKYEKLPPPGGVLGADGAHGVSATGVSAAGVGATGVDGAAGLEGASVGELTAQLGSQLSRLVRDELALAQLEAKQRGKKLGMGAGLLMVAGVLGFFGACAGVTAAIVALAMELRPWAAAIAVMIALFLLAGLLALPALLLFKSRKPAVPADTLDSVKSDVAAIKAAMHK